MEGTPRIIGSEGPDNSQAAFAATQSPMRPKKILVVDDSLVILKVLGLKLKTAGYEVLTAVDGGAAVNLARQHKPDLIVLDINFPPDVAHGGGVGWDAFTIMAWMQRMDDLAHIPVVIITSSDPAAVQDRSLAAGAAAFFHKPIDHDALLATIGKILGESGVETKKTT